MKEEHFSDQMISRRRFLRIAGMFGMSVLVGAAVREGYALSEKGVQISHLLNVLRHLLSSPDLFTYYLQQERAIRSGTVTSDFSTLQIREETEHSPSVLTLRAKGKLSGGETRDISAHVLVFPADLPIHISSSPTVSSEGVSIPLFVLARNEVAEGYDGGFSPPDALGGILFSDDTLGIASGDRAHVAGVIGKEKTFLQMPFVFPADRIPPLVSQDTYLWSLLATTTEGAFLSMTTDVGVRILVADQVRLLSSVLQPRSLRLDHIALTAKGSSNGIHLGDARSFGSPLKAARDTLQYLVITPRDTL